MSDLIVPADEGPPPEPVAVEKPAKLVTFDGEDASLLVPKDWRGPVLVVDLETCAEVQASKWLDRLNVKPIALLGLHKRKLFLTPEDAVAGRIKRPRSFALLGCTKGELTKKQKEIAAAKADALKKGITS